MIAASLGSKRFSAAGNLVVALSLILTAMFAVGAFALNTALFLLRREQLQTLAENTAAAAALSIPSRELTIQSAQAWYDLLRIQDGKEISPPRGAEGEPLTITINDNLADAGNGRTYKLHSVTVRISSPYSGSLFAPGTLKGRSIRISGQATAALQPADIVLIIDNSAALTAKTAAAPFPFASFGIEKAQSYAGQCGSGALHSFKRGAAALYDLLSQVGTYRVSTLLAASRTEEPLVLSALGDTEISSRSLEYDGDQPDYHSTRCAALTGEEGFAVPENINAVKGGWNPRRDLRPLLPGRAAADFSIPAEEPLLVREALWILPFGYSTESGYIAPQYYFTNPYPAALLAAALLKDSRRPDGRQPAKRLVLILTDQTGKGQDGAEASNGSYSHYCRRWNTDGSLQGLKLGIIFFGHDSPLAGRETRAGVSGGQPVDEMRRACAQPGGMDSGSFFIEDSPASGRTAESFAEETIPLAALGLKEAELVR